MTGPRPQAPDLQRQLLDVQTGSPRELAANLLPQQGTVCLDALLQQALLDLPPVCRELNGYLV